MALTKPAISVSRSLAISIMAEGIVQNTDPIRQTSPQAIRLAKTLMRTARFGALAIIEPQTQEPFVSRVAVATAMDGAPLILVSSLSTHTKSLLANPQCSLLLGEPGKGDPLAHPRITLQCVAQVLDRESEAGKSARQRTLRRNPKAKLYVDFGDFSFMKLKPAGASLNGGFGQAYRLISDDLLEDAALATQFEEAEADILEHMNKDHHDAVQAIGACVGAKSVKRWVMTGVDPHGVDLGAGETVARAWFDASAQSIGDIRQRLVDLTAASRSKTSVAAAQEN
ncbi:MAG: HugZ family protein [Rhizobiaceae bacterium]